MTKLAKFALFFAIIAIICVAIAKFITSVSGIGGQVIDVLRTMPTGELNYENADSYKASGQDSITEPIRSLDIEWVSGNVSVRYGDITYPTWKETYQTGQADESNQLRYTVDGDQLNIRFAKPGDWGDSKKGKRCSKNLTLTLPRGLVLDKIDVETVNGDVICNADAYEIEAGAINGNCNINTSVARKINAESVNGSNTVYLPKSTSFQAEMDKINGGIQVDFPFTKSGKKYTVGNAPYIEIKMETVNGSLSIIPQE